MGKRKQAGRTTRKVSASQYYKGKGKKIISRKERDKQIYRKTRDDGVKVSINNTNNPLISAVPGVIDRISSDNENEDEQKALAEALRTAMPLSGIQIQVSKKAKKIEDITIDEIRKKNRKSLSRKKEKTAGEKTDSNKNENNGNSRKDRDKDKIIKEDIVNDLKTEDKKKNHKDSAKMKKSGSAYNDIKEPGSNPENKKIMAKNESYNDSLRKRKLAEAAYADYILWKREQLKKRKEGKNTSQKNNDKEGKESTLNHSNANSKKKGKDENKDQQAKDDDWESQNKKAKRKSRRKKRRSRAVNPIVKNVKRNMAAAKNEVKYMPIKTLRMVTDDVSADELAMRAGRGIMGYMSRIYGNAMKTVGALGKSLALLAAEVAKDILIAFAPVLLISVILSFMIYFIFLSPMQSIMGGGDNKGEEVTAENNDILKAYCSEALLESADRLQQKILKDKPTAAIKIMTISEENLNDMCKIITVIMALYGAYQDDEDWLKSTEGKEELDKYAGFMCHQLSQSEIDEEMGNQEDETPTEEMTTEEATTEEATTENITEEPSTEPAAEDAGTDKIWIGYYSYEYLLENGYLSEIEEFIQ